MWVKHKWSESNSFKTKQSELKLSMNIFSPIIKSRFMSQNIDERFICFLFFFSMLPGYEGRFFSLYLSWKELDQASLY